MSDMRLTIRIDSELRSALRRKAKELKRSESEIARTALEKDLGLGRWAPGRRTAYAAFLEAGLIGCAPGGPPDLSTNPKYMEGFGEWKNDSHRRRPARRVSNPRRSVSLAVR